MTDQMYAKLQAPKPRRDRGIAIPLAVCGVICAFVLGLFLYAGWYLQHFRAFVRAFSDSTVYAYTHGGVQAQAGEQHYRITGDTVYLPYTQLTGTPGKLYRASPDTAPDLCLEYGDGAVLLLWAVELEPGAAHSTGIFWQFTAADGTVWRYDTDAFPAERLAPLWAAP